MVKTTDRPDSIFDNHLGRRTRWRGALLGTIIAIGLAGCKPVYTPAEKPIEIGVTTRQEVVAQLGEPSAICEDERVLNYRWDYVHYYASILLSGYITFHHMVLIQVDETDRVTRAEQFETTEKEGLCGKFVSDWAKGRVKDEYEARADELKIPERRALRQILLPNEAAAKRAEAMLGEGQSFEKVAQDVSGKAPIKIGTVTLADLSSPEFARTAFLLTEGSFSAPVATPLGWHIIQITKITPAQITKIIPGAEGAAVTASHGSSGPP